MRAKSHGRKQKQHKTQSANNNNTYPYDPTQREIFPKVESKVLNFVYPIIISEFCDFLKLQSEIHYSSQQKYLLTYSKI